MVELHALSDTRIIQATDPVTFRRGQDYHRRGLVVDLRQDDTGTVTAQVQGSRTGTYRVVVNATARGFRGYCSCPMQHQCKHVVATLLDLKERPGPHRGGTAAAPPTHPATPVASWESVLDRILVRASTSDAARPLALSIRLIEGHHGAPARIGLRPLAASLRGPGAGWVRTGAGWRDLEHHIGDPAHPLDVTHVDALLALYRVASRRLSYRGPDEIDLGSLGVRWPELLHDVIAAGVTLVDPRRGAAAPVVQTDPARLVGTLTPPDDGPADLTVGLEVPSDLEGQWQPLMGEEHEVVGVVMSTDKHLTLVPLERALGGERLALLRMRHLEIPATDWSRFAARLPHLRRLLHLSVPEGRELPQYAPMIHLDVTHAPHHESTVRITLRYTDPRDPTVPGQDVPLAAGGSTFRDPEAEGALLGRVAPVLDLAELWQTPTQPAPETTLRGVRVAALVDLLQRVADHDDIVVTEHGQAATYLEAAEGPVVEIGTGPAADGDWFDLLVEVTVGETGEHVPLGTLIAALAQGEPALMLESGTWFSLDRPELVRLAELLAEARMLTDTDGPLRLTPLHVSLWEELESLGVVTRQSDAWRRRVAALTTLSGHGSISVPAGLQATLRPYQVAGFQWLAGLWDAQLGGILADDMGLGKTLQVLSVVQRATEAGSLTDPVLIVCPTSVIGTWAREAARFCPGLEVAVLDQTRTKAGVALDQAVAAADVVVTSYTLLRLDEADFGTRRWSALVLDEAQFVKNHTAKGYAAARRQDAERTFVLTGTPLENSLMDLWSMLSLAAPGLYPRPDRFKEHVVGPIERDGSGQVLATLRRRIAPLMLRRTKETVAKELPAKQETVLPVPLTPKHRTVYDRRLQRERQRLLGLVDDLNTNRIVVFRALTLLRQLSLAPALVDDEHTGIESAKITLLVEHLRELAAEGHRALVFSTFTGFLRLVRERLTAEGVDHCYLDGRTRNRERVVTAFKEGTAPAFLISLKAGGFGLTLTEADYVYILDPWWNPAAETQAIDRAHRIGQDRPVNVYRLVSQNTIEEKVVALQERKRDLFARVIDDGGLLSSGALTADDIRGLLA